MTLAEDVENACQYESEVLGAATVSNFSPLDTQETQSSWHLVSFTKIQSSQDGCRSEEASG
jgi:hypothetical protein